jgi:hypothetical protein
MRRPHSVHPEGVKRRKKGAKGRADLEQKFSIAPRRRTNVRREEASGNRKGNTINWLKNLGFSTIKQKTKHEDDKGSYTVKTV